MFQNHPTPVDETPGTKYYCACGNSSSKPYCDGSHKGSGIVPTQAVISEAKKCFVCDCGHSGSKPFCDGAHKKLGALVAAAMLGASLLFSTPAEAKPMAIDATHSEVGFAVKHMMISTVKGVFGTWEGTVDWDAANPGKSTFDVTIDVASLDTRNDKRDEHLRSPDFFDAAAFPKIRLVSDKIVKKGKGYELIGKLTMKDVTKQVTIPFTATAAIKDPWGNERVGFEGAFELNRKEYHINYGQVMDNGGVMVSDEVKISIAAEAIATAPAAAPAATK